MLDTAARKPDILEVIADLSNDEVRTPPWVANAILDLLPDHVWSDPTLRWLDPGSKTGVFPREITKRLMVGLAGEIPNEYERLEHILKNQVLAIAITELTALMSRRTVYCSKRADSEHSTIRFDRADGNVWFDRVEHSYERGRCAECGASESQMESNGRDNHAYAFIHDAGMEALSKEFEMKFDVIVGNPPYQMDSDGSSRTMPIYNLFVDQAKALSPRYIAMIIPSRWMASGLGLTEFRAEMLGDSRIRKLVDFPNANEVFPGVEIKGGVCYFLWDRDNAGPCEVSLVRGNQRHGPVLRDLNEFDIFVRDSRGLDILHKVRSLDEPSLTEILAVDKEFGMTSNFNGYRMKRTPGSIAIHAGRRGKRIQGWIQRDNVVKSLHLIDTWKVLIPQAGSDGGQKIPDVVLGKPFIAGPPSVCTQTFLFVYVDSENAARSVESYVRTRLFRFLVSLRKISQHATRSTYTWVPQQSWDREWTDEELYEKYGITDEEQAYIAEMVKEIPA